MDTLFKSARDPKTLVLERTDDGRLRLVVSVRKLGAFTMVEYFLDEPEAQALSLALAK